LIRTDTLGDNLGSNVTGEALEPFVEMSFAVGDGGAGVVPRNVEKGGAALLALSL